MTFLFWNIKNKPLESVVANLAIRHQADLIILAECPDPGVLLSRLNTGGETQFFLNPTSPFQPAIYSRFSDTFMVAQKIERRYTIWQLSLPGCQDVLIVTAHLPSKLHRSDFSQHSDCFEFAKRIRDEEERVGHRRTVVVGDLNMNPFDPGMVDARGLHAVTTRGLAKRRSRRVQDETYPFFYNPMWRFFGDSGCHPPGTYYRHSGPVAFFWHIFDQVLIRPALLSSFDSETLAILVSDGSQSFLRENGVPNASDFSDHLPIQFRLNLHEGEADVRSEREPVA